MSMDNKTEKYKIAICDDDRIMADCIGNIVETYFADRGMRIGISVFCDGKELVQSDDDFDLVFLDIEMPNMDGMTAAKYLYDRYKRAKQTETKIVFLTSHEEAVRKAFQVQAFRFLVKDSYEDEIEECLDAFCVEKMENAIFDVECRGGMVKVRQNDILYIKSIHNGSEIWLEQDVLECKYSLDKWMDLLDDNLFFRAHKNSIVNLDKIDYIEEYIYLYNGDKVEYSVRNRTKLKKRYQQYIIDNAR